MTVLVYAYPANDGSKLKNYVYPYVYPYFHQSWSMFAPIPKQNFNIYVRHDGNKWHDVFNEIVLAHQRNRFGGYENISLSFSNAIRYYASSVKKENSIEVYKGGNENYNVLLKIIVHYLSQKNGSRPKDLEIIIRTSDSYGGKYNSHYYKTAE